MKFTESDAIQLENLIKSLKRAKFENMQGMEILAYAQMFDWVGSLHHKILQEIQQEQQKLVEKAKAQSGADIRISKAISIEEPTKPKPKRTRRKKTTTESKE